MYYAARVAYTTKRWSYVEPSGVSFPAHVISRRYLPSAWLNSSLADMLASAWVLTAVTTKFRLLPSLKVTEMLLPGLTRLRRANAAKTCAAITALPVSPGKVPREYHPTFCVVPFGTSMSPAALMPTFITVLLKPMLGILRRTGVRGPDTAGLLTLGTGAVAFAEIARGAGEMLAVRIGGVCGASAAFGAAVEAEAGVASGARGRLDTE